MVRDQNGNPSVYTFGYGVDHNEDMLRNVAETGEGLYYFVEDEDSIVSAFADCLGGILSVVAQNIKLNITAKDGVKLKKVYEKYKQTEKSKGKSIEMNMGDIFSEEERDILVLVELDKSKSDMDAQELVSVHLDYFNVIDSMPCQSNATAHVDRVTKLENEDKEADQDIEMHYQRFKTAQVMEEAGTLSIASAIIFTCLNHSQNYLELS